VKKNRLILIIDDKFKPKIVDFGLYPWIGPFSYGTFASIEIVSSEDEKFSLLLIGQLMK
jgi:hypothetical protein